jgi:hypothetical protein
MLIGYSTGSLAKGNFTRALEILSGTPNSANVIELSTLRESELPILIDAIPKLDLHKYKHISIHAPSKLISFSEDNLIEHLTEITRYGYPIVVHPDIIVDFDKWLVLGDMLCIENMDKRKTIGRTSSDLQLIFEHLPDARFCLDFAHAKQVDPSMAECARMLRQFSEKLMQYHISDVTSDCNHVPINYEAIISYRKVAKLVPQNIPIIIESPVSESYFVKEINYVKSIFSADKSYNKHFHPFVY